MSLTTQRLIDPIRIKGEQHTIDASSTGFRIHYKHENGRLFQGNSIDWLKSLDTQSVDLVFADPPYNIKKASWDSFKSQEEYIEWSIQWIEQASRILKENGSLYICGYSEILSDIKHPASKFFQGCRWLIWHYKNKASLQSDWGRSHESIIHFRKSKRPIFNVDDVRLPYGAHTLRYPDRQQADSSAFHGLKKSKDDSWTPHPLGAKPRDVIDIPTTCNGMGEKTPHPTQKPEELIRRFILASSNKQDIVLDPFSGSGTTLVAAEQLGRKWLGCDLSPEYNQWAINRLINVQQMGVDDWIKYDRLNKERREGIR